MSHELSIREDGTVEMAWFGERPWHGLGTEVKERMTPMAALQAAKIDVDAIKVPMFYRDNGGRVIEVPDKFASVRSDNGRYYGTVGTGYRHFQTREQAQFIEALVGEGAVVETVGALYGGARTFWACRIPGELRVEGSIKMDDGKGDRIEQYLTLINGHDGAIAFRAFWTRVRVVCANTWRAATGGAGFKEGFSIRHSKNMTTRVADAQKILGLVRSAAKQEEAALSDLAVRRMADRAEAMRLLDETFGTAEEDATPAAKTRLQNVKERVLINMLEEAKRFRPGSKGYSRWDLFNGITYWTSHQMGVRETKDSGTDAERRVDSLLLGSGNRITEKALAVLTDPRAWQKKDRKPAAATPAQN